VEQRFRDRRLLFATVYFVDCQNNFVPEHGRRNQRPCRLQLAPPRFLVPRDFIHAASVGDQVECAGGSDRHGNHNNISRR
jgi:hypothetical protein